MNCDPYVVGPSITGDSFMHKYQDAELRTLQHRISNTGSQPRAETVQNKAGSTHFGRAGRSYSGRQGAGRVKQC